MLFPGAIYIVGGIAIVVALAFSVAAGWLVGALIYELARLIVIRTKTFHDMQIGKHPYNGKAWPWWVHLPVWFGLSWFWGFVVILYAISGPIWSLLLNMKGL